MSDETSIKKEVDKLTMKIKLRKDERGLTVYGHGHLNRILNAPFVVYEYKVEDGTHWLILHPYITKIKGATTATSPDSSPDTWINYITGDTADELVKDGFVECEFKSFGVNMIDSDFGTFRSITVNLDSHECLNGDTSSCDDHERLLRIEKMLADLTEDMNVIRRWLNAE